MYSIKSHETKEYVVKNCDSLEEAYEKFKELYAISEEDKEETMFDVLNFYRCSVARHLREK